jgi:hypothetical protein
VVVVVVVVVGGGGRVQGHGNDLPCATQIYQVFKNILKKLVIHPFRSLCT